MVKKEVRKEAKEEVEKNTQQAMNVAATQQLFQAFGAQDIPGILEYLDETIVIEFYGPQEIPYAGTYSGKGEARRFFETVLASVDIREFTPQEFLADADKVVVTGHLHLVAKSTGKEIASDFVHVITLKDEKWVRFRDFMDTTQAYLAFSD